MTTKIVKVDPLNPQEDVLGESAQVLRNGGLVIVPTETVYGIAADADNKKTIERLYEIKGRPGSKPFSLHVHALERVEEFAVDIPVLAYKLMDRFWPGPLTLVFKSKDSATIAIRVPDNKFTLRLLELSGVNVVCPSANLSGNPAPASFQDAIKDLEGKVDLAIDGADTKVGLESSVVDVTSEQLRVLREGALKEKDIRDVASKKTVLFVCTGNSCRSVMAESYMKKRLQEKNRQDVEVLSAGILGLNNMSSTYETKQVLKREGIDVEDHRSTKVSARMIKKSDIILVMEKMHEERILELAPQARSRVFLLKEFAKIEDDGSLSIPDPIGNSIEFYERTFYTIKEAVNRVVEIV